MHKLYPLLNALRFLIFCLPIFSCIQLQAQPELVKDINKEVASYLRLQPFFLTDINGTVYFSGSHPDTGSELWKSDGTSQGTVLIKDIYPGFNSSAPSNLTDVNGTLYFLAYNPASGRELWKSDGTAAGTVMVKEINPVWMDSFDSNGAELTNVDGTLYFVATDGIGGFELWKSDGTANGTIKIKDIYPGTNSSFPSNLNNINGTLYFAADDGISGKELWTSDGTEAGTVKIKDIYVGSASSYPAQLTVVNDVIYFVADDGVSGNELWKSNGTVSGTVKVKDICSGSWSSAPTGLVNVDGTLFFSAFDFSTYTELWKSDGTELGTVRVKDINPGTSDSYPSNLTNVNGILYFVATDGVSGYELWKSNGTASGTIKVKDIYPGNNTNAIPHSLISCNGLLYFASFGLEQTGLWRSDGTGLGTVRIKDTYPWHLARVHNMLYFAATVEERNSDDLELWKSDGTELGTVVVKEIKGNISLPSSPQRLTNADHTLYFIADDGIRGKELWKSDGTAVGTTIVKDIISGTNSPFISNASPFATVNGTLYFVTTDGVSGYELWKSDGTESTTVRVKDIYPGMDNSYPLELLNLNGTLYFTADDGATGRELWKSDGTEAGTVRIKDIKPGSNGSFAYSPNLVASNGILYFIADDGSSGRELWKSDGTTAGTVKIKDIVSGTGSPFPYDSPKLTNVNGIIYFVADDGSNGYELWKSDGTEAGTLMVKDINPGIASSLHPISHFTAMNGMLYFVANDSRSGYELWRSDGTEAGTVRITDINLGSNSSFTENNPYLTPVNGTLYFTADDETNGRELWKSDGTTAGTLLVKDIYPGKGNSTPKYLTDVNGTLCFIALDEAGQELWRSDGTEHGTLSVKDIYPNNNGFDYESTHYFVQVNGTLYFEVNDGIHGKELWKYNPSTCIMPDTSLNVTSDTVCANTSAVITVKGTQIGVSYQLYNNSSKLGDSINGGGDINFDILPAYMTGDTNEFTIKATGCVEYKLIQAANVMVRSSLVAPQVTGDTINIGEKATLTASGLTKGIDFHWYMQELGGTIIGTGTTYITSELTSSTPYYVASYLPGCSESPRTKVIATINNNPTVSFIPDQVIEQDSILVVQFTVQDTETVADQLVITTSTDNPTLLPEGSMAFSGIGENRTLTLTPAKGTIGSAKITLTVKDDQTQIQKEFTLKVERSIISGLKEFSKNNEVIITPNPTDRFITILLPQEYSHLAKIRLYSSLGKQMQVNTSQSHQATILDLHQLIPGLYHLEIMVGKEVWVRKIIKL